MSFLWCNSSIADFKTFKCIEFMYYLNDEGTLETILYNEPDDSKKNITLIVDDSVVEDKTGHWPGKVTLINEAYKHEYFITSHHKKWTNAIRHYYITDEVINRYEGSIKDFIKKKKGHLYHISFMKLQKEEFNNWYLLTIIRSQNLYMINHFNYSMSVEAEKETYRCSE